MFSTPVKQPPLTAADLESPAKRKSNSQNLGKSYLDFVQEDKEKPLLGDGIFKSSTSSLATPALNKDDKFPPEILLKQGQDNYLPYYFLNSFAEDPTAFRKRDEFLMPLSSLTSPSSAYKKSRALLNAYNEDDAPPVDSILDSQVEPLNVVRNNESPFTTNKLRTPISRVKSSSGVDIEETSIIAFGFPPAAASTILAKFRDFGEVVNYRLPTDGANWMIITYKSRSQALRAASQNGMMMESADGAKWMIGIRPHEEEDSSAESRRRRLVATPTKVTLSENSNSLFDRAAETLFFW